MTKSNITELSNEDKGMRKTFINLIYVCKKTEWVLYEKIIVNLINLRKNREVCDLKNTQSLRLFLFPT